MTQFGPPPVPLSGMSMPDARSGPPPWSAAAIGAFVLSLLGFLGITAVLGLIFSIVGIVATRGGRRRGMGLAIAAIPIAIITGALAVIILFAVLVFGRMTQIPHKLEPVFAGGDPVAQTSTLRQLASDEWNQTAKDEQLVAWLNSVRKKHGAITALTLDPNNGFALSPEGAAQLSLSAKFVNGPAAVRITFDSSDVWSTRIADLEVDGMSARRSTEDPSLSPPTRAPP